MILWLYDSNIFWSVSRWNFNSDYSKPFFLWLKTWSALSRPCSPCFGCIVLMLVSWSWWYRTSAVSEFAITLVLDKTIHCEKKKLEEWGEKDTVLKRVFCNMFPVYYNRYVSFSKNCLSMQLHVSCDNILILQMLKFYFLLPWKWILAFRLHCRIKLEICMNIEGSSFFKVLPPFC